MVAKPFVQLYTIHGRLERQKGFFPCVYILMSCRDAKLYFKAFSILKYELEMTQCLRPAMPRFITIDFEAATHKTFKLVFPWTYVAGSMKYVIMNYLRLF